MFFQALFQGLPFRSRHGQRLVAVTEVLREWTALCPEYGEKEAAAWQFSRSTGFGALLGGFTGRQHPPHASAGGQPIHAQDIPGRPFLLALYLVTRLDQCRSPLESYPSPGASFFLLLPQIFDGLK